MLNEVKLITEKLNDELYDKLGDERIYFSFKSDSYVIIIEFLGVDFWNNEDDDRDIICGECNSRELENNCCDQHQEYEPLEDFLRREANELIKILRDIVV